MKQHAAMVALMAALNTQIGVIALQLSYATSVVTQCYDALESGVVSATDATSAPPPQGTVCYSMPACEACGCPSCTITSTFTTTYSVFCPTGLTAQPYTVTETYVGISSLPSFSPPTTIPYGFTTSQATCTICGTTTLVTPMTYPSGRSPYSTETHDGSDPTHDAATGTSSAMNAQEATTVAGGSSTTIHATIYTTFLTVKTNTTDFTSIINGTPAAPYTDPTDQVGGQPAASPEDTPSALPSSSQTNQNTNSGIAESSSTAGVYSSAAYSWDGPALLIVLLVSSLGVSFILFI